MRPYFFTFGFQLKLNSHIATLANIETKIRIIKKYEGWKLFSTKKNEGKWKMPKYIMMSDDYYLVRFILKVLKFID